MQFVVAAPMYLQKGNFQMPLSVIKHALMSAAIIFLLSGCGSGDGGGSGGGIGGSPTGARNVTVSWTPPLSNTDGSSLLDLAGYKIYYGTSSRAYSSSLAIDEGLASFVLEGLGEATWYFAMTAVNDAGIESNYSEEVSFRVTTN